jgi:hypothetical protein
MSNSPGQSKGATGAAGGTEVSAAALFLHVTPCPVWITVKPVTCALLAMSSTWETVLHVVRPIIIRGVDRDMTDEAVTFESAGADVTR